MKILKLTFISLFALLMVNNSIAQSVKWGTLQKSKWNNFSPNFIGDDANNLYSYFLQSGKLHVTAFDRDRFKAKYDTEIPKLKINKANVKIEKISITDKHYIIIGSYFKKEKNKDEKEKKNHIVAYKVDKLTGKLIKGHQEIFDVDVDRKSRRGDFDVYSTPDKSKFLIVHSAYQKAKKRTIATFKLYDNDLNLIQEFEEDFVSRGTDENSIDRINNLIVDNDGSIYYLVGVNKFVSLDANKDYEKWEEPIDIEKYQPNAGLSQLRFIFDRAGDIQVFGFYHEIGAGFKGVFHLKLDYLSKEIIHAKVSKFSKKFLENLKSKRQKRKEKKGKDIKLKNVFNLMDLTPQEDGALAVVAESYSYVYISNEQNYSESISYGDVAVLNITKDGDLGWAKYLPKKQLFAQSGNGYINTGTFKGYIRLLSPANSYNYTKHFSTISGVQDDKIIVVYNNHKKNTLKTPKKKLKTLSFVKKAKCVSIVYNIKTGKAEESEVKNGKQQDAPLAPVIYYETSDGKSIIVFGQKRRNFKLGELKL